MTERERLIELLRTVDNMRLMRKGFSECADYLLENGVVIPVRCKDCEYVSPMKFFCNRYKYAILENGFCNKGKLKERAQK